MKIQMLTRAMEIFEKYGSINYTHDIALENVENAKKLLETLEESEATVALAMIADYVLQRNIIRKIFNSTNKYFLL